MSISIELYNQFLNKVESFNEFEIFIIEALKRKHEIVSDYFKGLDSISCLEFIEYLFVVEVDETIILDGLNANDEYTTFYSLQRSSEMSYQQVFSINELKNRIVYELLDSLDNAILILKYHLQNCGQVYDVKNGSEIKKGDALFDSVLLQIPLKKESLLCESPCGYCLCDSSPKSIEDYFSVDLTSLSISKAEFDITLEGFKERVSVELHEKAKKKMVALIDHIKHEAPVKPKRADLVHHLIDSQLKNLKYKTGTTPTKKQLWAYLKECPKGVSVVDSRNIKVEGKKIDYEAFTKRIAVKHLPN